MATEFDDSAHWGLFLTGSTLTSQTGKTVRQSALTLAALRAAGVFDNMEDGTTPPATDRLWLDKNIDPPVLKEWDSVGSAWMPMTFDRLFGRAIVTPLTVTGGTGNAITVSKPANFISNRLYSLTPAADNDGPMTITVAGAGTFDVRYSDGSVVQPEEFKAGVSKLLLFASGRFEVVVATYRVEAATAAAEAAEGAAEAAQHAAEAAQSAAEAAAAGVDLPPVTANTMLVDNPTGTAREAKTFDEVKELWDPAADLLYGEGLKLTYHKARGSRHVRAFGSSLTEVGGGNEAADTAALKAAIASQEIIDITGANLRINDVIDIDYPGACIVSALSNRVGAVASSSIFVTDDAMPKLFNVSATNFEVDGFRLEANAANTATTWFHYERPAGSASDIDCVLERLSATYGRKLFHIFGRGLKVRDATVAMPSECVGDIDWPSSWTPNGQSNDTQKTGMRAYEFADLRFHGTPGGIRNIGANAKNCRGISMANVLADIGGANGVFSGVAVESRFVNIGSHINAVTAGLLFDIHGGSTKSEFIGFHGGGIKDGTDERLSNNVINIRPTATDPISDLHFIGGSIGPCRRNGLQIAGGGVAKNILLQGVTFDRPGLDGGTYVPISIFDNGGTLTEVSLKMSACNFELPGLAPTQIVGGKNSNVITIMKDTLTTKPAAIPWAQANVVIA